jgi:hypothetical protein
MAATTTGKRTDELLAAELDRLARLGDELV